LVESQSRAGDRVAGRIAETTAVRLSGYGVELAIKSQEYKAQDDSAINVKGELADGDDDADELDLQVCSCSCGSIFQGFNFAKLKELHPEMSEELNAYKTSLYEVDELEPLKQWELQDLAFQVRAPQCTRDHAQFSRPPKRCSTRRRASSSSYCARSARTSRSWRGASPTIHARTLQLAHTRARQAGDALGD